MKLSLPTVAEDVLNIAPWWVWGVLIIGTFFVVKGLYNKSLDAVGYP